MNSPGKGSKRVNLPADRPLLHGLDANLGTAMTTTTQTHRDVGLQAWRRYRLRDIPGSLVRIFADALRRAWAWVKGAAERAAAEAWRAGRQDHRPPALAAAKPHPARPGRPRLPRPSSRAAYFLSTVSVLPELAD